jgi:YD repeat-containing protein
MGVAVRNTLDEEGNQTSVTDPLGRTVTKTYDALGRLTSVTEPDEGGATRTTTYRCLLT